MKHHLNIILLAMRIMIVCIGITALYNLFYAYISVVTPDEAISLINEKFHKSPKPINIDTTPLPYYFASCGLLWCYLVYVLVQLHRSFSRLEKGNVFYDKQPTEFKRAGGGLIIFAKCNYLLHCGFGAVFFMSFLSFFKEIPQFLFIYLTGKLVLVMYHLAKKGTFLKEEADLTI